MLQQTFLCFLTLTLIFFPGTNPLLSCLHINIYQVNIYMSFPTLWKKDTAHRYLRSMTSQGPAVLTGVDADTSCKSIDISGPMNNQVSFRRMCRRKYFSQAAMTHCATTWVAIAADVFKKKRWVSLPTLEPLSYAAKINNYFEQNTTWAPQWSIKPGK